MGYCGLPVSSDRALRWAELIARVFPGPPLLGSPPTLFPPSSPLTAGESASCSDSQPLASAMNRQMCRGERWLRVWGPQVLAALVALRCLQAAVACHLFGSLRCPWQRGWSAASPSAFPRSGSQEFTAGLHGWTSPGEIPVQMAGRQSLCVSPLLRRRVRVGDEHGGDS